MKNRSLIQKTVLLLLQYGVLTCLVICNAAYGQGKKKADQLDYHLGWDGKSSDLKVNLTYQTAGKDTTAFIFGDPVGGQADIFDILKNIHAGKGDQLIIRREKRELLIVHQSAGLKSLGYTINAPVVINPKRARPNELFRPVIMPGSLYIIGYNLFLQTTDKAYRSFSVVWDQFPSGMTYFVSSAPVSKPNITQTMSLEKGEQLLIVGGSDIIRKTHNVYGVPYYAITSKRDKENDMQKELLPFFNSFFPSNRDFWQDRSGKYYFLCLLPLYNEIPSGCTGYNLGDGFVMKYRGPLDTLKKEVIAHETSHTYISGALKMKSAGMENNWFNEGFNDYICIFNLIRSKMLTKEEFLDYVNGSNLKPHYLSPVNTAPGDSIESHFWTDKNYERLPYQRGFIYAFYLDNQIRIASGGRRNIRDFLLALLRQTRKQQLEKISPDDFAKAMTGFLPPAQVSEDIQNYMLNGRLLDFHQVKLIEEFQIVFDQNVPVLKIADQADFSQLFNWKE